MRLIIKYTWSALRRFRPLYGNLILGQVLHVIVMPISHPISPPVAQKLDSPRRLDLPPSKVMPCGVVPNSLTNQQSQSRYQLDFFIAPALVSDRTVSRPPAT